MRPDNKVAAGVTKHPANCFGSDWNAVGCMVHGKRITAGQETRGIVWRISLLERLITVSNFRPP